MKSPLASFVCSLLLFASAAHSCAAADFWLDLVDGEETTTDAVLTDLATAGVVYVGEAHTIARHHAVQLQLFQSLSERGVPLVLCLEQLDARDQPTIDRYNRGDWLRGTTPRPKRSSAQSRPS